MAKVKGRPAVQASPVGVPVKTISSVKKGSWSPVSGPVRELMIQLVDEYLQLKRCELFHHREHGTLSKRFEITTVIQHVLSLDGSETLYVGENFRGAGVPTVKIKRQDRYTGKWITDLTVCVMHTGSAVKVSKLIQ